MAGSKPKTKGINIGFLRGKSANIAIKPDSEQSVSGTAILPDVYGDPTLRLVVSTPRGIYRKGQETLQSFLWAACGVAVFFVVLCIFLMERLVLRRLGRIIVDVTDVARLGELSGRVSEQGTDELGRVTLSINHMLRGAERADIAVRESEAQAAQSDAQTRDRGQEDLKNSLRGSQWLALATTLKA